MVRDSSEFDLWVLCLELLQGPRARARTPEHRADTGRRPGWTGTSLQKDAARPDSKSDYYSTANLERLAREGMRFSNAYAPAPMCSPTRASIQTGKSSAQLHVTDIIEGGDKENDRYQRLYTGKKLIPPLPRRGLPESEVSIAEFIKRHRPEYSTAHFGKWHLGSGGPGKHGYDVHDGDTNNFNGNSDDPDPKETFSVSERAGAYLESRSSQGQPFFMQISYYAVHKPSRFLGSTRQKYDSRPPGERHAHAAHAAMTEDLDTGLGYLLDKMEELGIEDTTYVVYVSDNGACTDLCSDITNNLPLAEGKGHTREGGIRVPHVIRGPGIEKNSQSDVPVIGWDFFPTFKSMLGIDATLPRGVEGGDLLPLLRGGRTAAVQRPREELVWHFPHYIDVRGVTPQSALRLGDYKFIYEYETGESFLYDLGTDLEEKDNLVDHEIETARSLRDRLEKYLDDHGAGLPRENRRF